ncbi:MAG: hypothetical protein NT132_08520 [Microbacterium sp.]|uniref:hypothetical protein n=1 Tax=Microbacterium sp. TaxID=51671 RepID=UPI0026251965|nr:hypothetical protein [Microbacterium sp.]MCX6502431.1 hypothetical protein [Microbacterium sp.]
MSDRRKWLIVAIAAALALTMTSIVGVFAWRQHEARAAAPALVDTAPAGSIATGERIVFRNTAPGAGYGHVASVPLADPSGTRSVDRLVCDRVDATAEELSCLRIERGIVPSYSATLYAWTGERLQEWPLPGIPSRTRLSVDGSILATTAFVTGHSYATIGFSTETVIRSSHGESLGNLEEWTLLIDGAPTTALDRNFWGVTFDGDTAFYATAALTASGTTYLVRGDVASRTLTALAENVECPSLSPDGSRIAFKRVTAGSGPGVQWTPAIYDLVTGEVSLLPESRSVDDQIMWLDDNTILYGMPRPGAVGDSDVWALAADGSGDPRLFIEHAWSPAVIREGT